MIKTKELRQHVKTRDEVTSDQYVCGEVCNEYRDLLIEDRVVLDLGANIGAFSVYADMRGARKVIAFEPEDTNWEMFQVNAGWRDSVEGHQAAIVPDDQTWVSFWLTNGSARDGYSTIPFRGRREVVVPARNFWEVLEEHKPQSIKMDIEGGEWELLGRQLPAFVEEIVVELHFNKRMFRGLYEKTVEDFSGWDTIRVPKHTGQNFHTLAHWRRAE